MDDAVPRSLLFICLLLAGGFFAGTETALSYCNRIRMQVLADDGDKLDRDSINILDTVTVDAEGQSIVLSAEETVYNVRIYTESRTLWQRNYLTTGEGVEVKSYIPDTQANIAVRYQLADGTEVIRGIFQSGSDGSIILVDLVSGDSFNSLSTIAGDEVRNF